MHVSYDFCRNLYRPPNTVISNFLDEYKHLILWLKSPRKMLIIGCDHNMDLLESMMRCSTESFVDLNLDNDLLPCIMKPTRITKETATLIDNIFVSSCLSERITSSIIVNDMSDHLPCKVSINNMFPLKNKAVTQEIRKVTKKKVECVIKELNSTDWTFLSENENMTSCNELFNKFADILQDTVDRNIPIKKIIGKRLKPSSPWLSPNLCKCINICKKLYAEAIQKGSSTTSWTSYMNYCNVLNRTKCGAMKNYFSNKCNEFKNNGKRLWQIIQNVTNCQKNKGSIIDCLEVDNIKCFESKLIAEEFAVFFSKVGLNYSNQIKKPKEVCK